MGMMHLLRDYIHEIASACYSLMSSKSSSPLLLKFTKKINSGSWTSSNNLKHAFFYSLFWFCCVSAIVGTPALAWDTTVDHGVGGSGSFGTCTVSVTGEYLTYQWEAFITGHRCT